MKRVLILLACLVLGVALTAPAASARVVPRDARLYGAPYEAWLAHHWRAAAKRSVLAETSLLALQGNRCGLDTGKVWFLPVSGNGFLHTHCRIPRGHHVLVLIGGFVDWGRDPEAMIASVDAGFAQLVDWTFTVDGRATTSHVVETAIFPVTLGPNNLLGEAPGTYSTYNKARMAILTPLRPGTHTITTAAHFVNPDDRFGLTYHLTVG